MQTDFSKIKCIAFDLDDTILDTGKCLSDRTREALTQAVEKGLVIIPVSGRSYDTFPVSIKELPGLSYAVTSNGSAIYDSKTHERIHSWLLKAQDVRSIMKGVGNFFLEGQITYEAFVDGVAYASADYVAAPTRFGVPQSAVSYIQQTRRPDRFIIDFIFDNAKRLDSLDLILKSSGMYRLVENAVKRSAENIYVTSSVPYRMEISSKESGKASGLKYVLDLLRITPEETIAFGDGDNDADMLHYAGIGVAVGNATDTCKKSADIILEQTSSENAAADFLVQKIINN